MWLLPPKATSFAVAGGMQRALGGLPPTGKPTRAFELSPPELARIKRIIASHEIELRHAWDVHFGHRGN